MTGNFASEPLLFSNLEIDGRFFSRSLPRTYIINLLIVCDGRLTYERQRLFSLLDLVDALTSAPTAWGEWLSFNVATAYRAGDPDGTLNATIKEALDFSKHDLLQYDQIWLFGDENGAIPNTALGDAELQKLAEFMNRGGGVFATGDHQNLGDAICGRVPRVRSMRRWFFNDGSGQPDATGRPEAPPLNDMTLTGGRKNHNTIESGSDEANNIPQKIILKKFSVPGGLDSPDEMHPFPILEGPRGAIMVLPDHLHEGLCEDDIDLSRTYQFDGSGALPEYPTQDGHQEQPMVIAHSRFVNSTEPFGAICVYDGHRIEQKDETTGQITALGRVVVDASFHHFTFSNLKGFLNDTAQENFEDIKAYYRNLALWLAHPSKQVMLRNLALWRAYCNYDVLSALGARLDNMNARDLMMLGTVVFKALRLFASEAQVLVWVNSLLQDVKTPYWINPWSSRQLPARTPSPWFDAKLVSKIVLGGVVYELASSDVRKELEGRDRFAELDLKPLLTKGANQSIDVLHQEIRRSSQEMLEMLN